MAEYRKSGKRQHPNLAGIDQAFEVLKTGAWVCSFIKSLECKQFVQS
jgi:hypothetical protein